MKLDFFKKGEDTGFFFKKRDIQNDDDKKIIAEIISNMYHAHCLQYEPSISEIDEIINSKNRVEIGILIHFGEKENECGYEPDVKTYILTKSKKKAEKING